MSPSVLKPTASQGHDHTEAHLEKLGPTLIFASNVFFHFNRVFEQLGRRFIFFDSDTKEISCRNILPNFFYSSNSTIGPQ